MLVFILISMYWRGCRHPASLCWPSLHPSTALERWISRFSLVYQLDHGREILDLFAAAQAGAIESETALDSCGFTTLA